MRIRTLALIVGMVALAMPVAPPPEATAAVTAPRPFVGAPTWLGMASDQVGRLSAPGPNGERDAHVMVKVVVPARTFVKQVVLQRVLSPTGYAEAWDTTPGTSASILGVVFRGQRVNPVDRDISLRLYRGTYFLHLYANDHAGVFSPGQRFRVIVTFAPGGAVVGKPTTLPGTVAATSARWGGIGADVVGSGTTQSPNGVPDAHLTVVLDPRGAWRVVEDVTLRHLTPTGALDLPIYHMQGPFTLGLFVNGVRTTWPTVMREHISIYVPLDPALGPATLELSADAPSASLFRSGELWQVAVTFSDSLLMKDPPATVRIP